MAIGTPFRFNIFVCTILGRIWIMMLATLMMTMADCVARIIIGLFVNDMWGCLSKDGLKRFYGTIYVCFILILLFKFSPFGDTNEYRIYTDNHKS